MIRTIEEAEFIHKKIESLDANEKIKEVLVAINNEGTTIELLTFLYDICLFDFKRTGDKNRIQSVKNTGEKVERILNMRYNEDKGEVKISITYPDEEGRFPIDVYDRTMLIVDKEGNCTFGNETRDAIMLKFRINRERIEKYSMSKEVNVGAIIRGFGFDDETEQQIFALFENTETHDLLDNMATYPREEYEKEQGGDEIVFGKRYGKGDASTETFCIKRDQDALYVEVEQYDHETKCKYERKLCLANNGFGQIDYYKNNKLYKRDSFVINDGKITEFATEKFGDEKKLG